MYRGLNGERAILAGTSGLRQSSPMSQIEAFESIE